MAHHADTLPAVAPQGEQKAVQRLVTRLYGKNGIAFALYGISYPVSAPSSKG